MSEEENKKAIPLGLRGTVLALKWQSDKKILTYPHHKTNCCQDTYYLQETYSFLGIEQKEDLSLRVKLSPEKHPLANQHLPST